MIELILFVGLLWLFVLHSQMATRLGQIEKELRDLRDGVPSAARPAETQIRPAVAIPAATATTAEIRKTQARKWLDGARESLDAQTQADEPSVPAMRETLATLFERFVGGRLLIWIGGIALAVAGIFLVRYSIEIGLITPPVRMIVAGLFGMILLAAGEFVRTRTAALGDLRTSQALVGAGILVLYATPYGALVLYQLLSLGTASALMVAVTLLALILSLRHGAPAAVMGLVGGFVTPLLVGDPDAGAVPLLFYLALLNGAIFTIARRRGWTWLVASATLLSFAWTGALLMAPPDDALAAGLFILVLGVAASLIKAGEGWHLDFLRPAAIGLVELAILVGRTDLGIPAWGLYGALALACLFLSTRRPEYRLLPPFALALALVLLAGKAVVGPDPLLLWVAAVITVLFGGFASFGALRGGQKLMMTMTAAAAFAAPAIILRVARPETFERPAWGLLMILIAAAPSFLAWSRRGDKEEDGSITVAAGTSLLLLGIAASDLVPRDLLGGAWLLLAIGTILAGRRLAASGLAWLALSAAAFATLWAVAMVPEYWATLLQSLLGEPALAANLPDPARVPALLLLPAALLASLWRLLPAVQRRFRAAPLAAAILFFVVVFYIFLKQIFALSSAEDFVARGFAERLLITQALFLSGWLLGTGRVRLPALESAHSARIGTWLTIVAAARLLWFDILIHNPVLTAQAVGSMPVFNLLLPAYLLSAVWLYGFRRRAGNEAVSGAWLALFLVSLVLGVMLMVRQLFHGAILTASAISSTESYGYSLAGLVLSMGLLLSGIRLPDKALRLAGLVLLTLTILKVFISDASALEGLLRILSFLGLGVALIGIGKLYSAVLSAEAGKARETRIADAL